ncbi:MAG: hypothetical protein R3E91_00405 [Chlamydiales bacterium]
MIHSIASSSSFLPRNSSSFLPRNWEEIKRNFLFMKFLTKITFVVISILALSGSVSLSTLSYSMIALSCLNTMIQMSNNGSKVELIFSIGLISIGFLGLYNILSIKFLAISCMVIAGEVLIASALLSVVTLGILGVLIYMAGLFCYRFIKGLRQRNSI